ncbi:MAG: glycosyltransferase [Solirubrobacterales bacterium]
MGARLDKGRKLRVVTLIDQLGLTGGAERVATEVVQRLDPDRFERTLCVSRWKSHEEDNPLIAPRVGALRDADVRIVGIRRTSRGGVWAWWPLVKLLREERVDILHSHQFGSNLWASILGRIAATPVVIAHEHNWSFDGEPLRQFLDRHVIATRAAAFLAVSRQTRQAMIDLEGIDPDRVRFIPLGIATPPARPGGDVRAELGISEGAPVIGTACTLRPEKALDVLIRAAAALREDFADLRVLIAGDGPDRARVEALITELELGEVVTLLGGRGDIPDFLRALDVAVCSSDWEGSPLSVMEYMEAELPVVATRVGGIPDMIENGVEGVLVDPGDPAAIAGAVGSLLRDPGRAAEMGRNGRRRRREEFDLDVTARLIGELYEELYAAARG